MLARNDIDAVMISTPDHWHVPMALAGLAAGKDVSLEKPITRTIAEGRQLSDAAEPDRTASSASIASCGPIRTSCRRPRLSATGGSARYTR